MEQPIKIVVPTKGRPQAICAHKFVSNTIICVEESEHGIYKEHNPDYEFLVHPDSVKGLSPKREWISKKVGSVFMMDDDIKGFSRMSQKQGESSKVSPELAYHVIQWAASMARIMGCYLFGFSKLVNPQHYSGHNPFKMTGTIDECAFGILSGAPKLKIEDKMTLGYEFYMSGINAYHYRKAFFDMRYTPNHASFGDDVGGCANMRTLETEKKDLELLKYYFGNAVQSKVDSGKKGKHQFSKNLIIPF